MKKTMVTISVAGMVSFAWVKIGSAVAYAPIEFKSVTSAGFDLPRMLLAQHHDSGGGDDNEPSEPFVSISKDRTDQLLQDIQSVNDICRSEIVIPEFRISCLETGFRRIADRLPSNGDYSQARGILNDLARQLRGIQRANDDPNAERGPRLRMPGSEVVVGPLDAILSQNVPAAADQARNVIAETQTRLLRSAENSARRQVAYQQIASVLDSSKFLLRS